MHFVFTHVNVFGIVFGIAEYIAKYIFGAFFLRLEEMVIAWSMQC